MGADFFRTLYQRHLVVLFALSVLVAPLSAETGDALIQSLKPEGMVTDRAGLLSGTTKRQLESLLLELKDKTGAEVAVVTLPSMQGGQIDDFTNRLFEAWGVGQKGVDDGVLLLVAVEDRKMRIEVGYGLESAIPDGKAGQIRDRYIIPYFKQGSMEQGVVQGSVAIADTISHFYGVALTGERPSRPATRPQSSRESIGLFKVVWILALIFIIGRGFFLPMFFPTMRGGSNGGSGRYGHWGGGGFGGGGYGGGGFGGGGFGGGMSGGGGASGGW